MKDYKIAVLNEMEKLSSEFHAIKIRTAAQNVGIKHLKTQECEEVLNAFVKKHNDYKIYKLADNPKDSLFCAAFVSDNETVPV